MWHFLHEKHTETQKFWCQLLHRKELLVFGNWYFPTETLVQFGGQTKCDSLTI